MSLHYQFLNPFFYITTHAKGQGGPFFGVYQAGINLNNRESIYGCEGYRAPSEVAVPYYHFYRYLPFCSLLSSIASRFFTPWQAYWIWITVNEILLAACIILTLRLRRVFGPAAIAVASFWLIFSPLYIELYMGQFCFTMSFFIFLLLYPYLKEMRSAPGGADPHGAIAGGIATMTNGGNRNAHANTRPEFQRSGDGVYAGDVGCAGSGSRSTSPLKRKITHLIPGICWIISVLVKNFTALYSLPLIRMGRKKLVLAGAIVAAVTSIPYFVWQPNDFNWFLRLNFQPLPSNITGGALGFNPLLMDITDRLIPIFSLERLDLGLFDIAYMSMPAVCILLAIILITILLTARKKPVDPLSSITLWTLTFFLVFKDIWEYHYVMLIPLFIGFYLKTRSNYLLVLFFLLAVPTPFYLFDIPGSTNPQELWTTPQSLLQHSFKALPTFLFYVWVAKREIRDLAGLKALFSPGRKAAQTFAT